MRGLSSRLLSNDGGTVAEAGSGCHHSFECVEMGVNKGIAASERGWGGAIAVKS